MGDFSSLLVDDEVFLDYWISGGIDVLTFLPEEITMRIIKSLDMKTICRLAQTNKKLQNFCDRDDVWIELCLQNEIISEDSEVYRRKKNIERTMKPQQPSKGFWKNIFQDCHQQEQNWKKGIASQDLLLNFTFTWMQMGVFANSYLVVYGNVGNSQLAVLWDITTNAFLSTLYDGDSRVHSVHVNGLYAIVVCETFFRVVSLTFLNAIDPLDIESAVNQTFNTPQIQFGLSGFFVTQGDNIHYFSLFVDTGEGNGHIVTAEELVLKCPSRPVLMCSIPDSRILFTSHTDGILRVWTNLNPSHPADYICTQVDKFFDDIHAIHYCQQADLVILSSVQGVFACIPHTLNFVYHIPPSVYSAHTNYPPDIQFAYPNMLLSNYDMVALVHIKTGKVNHAYEFNGFAHHISIRGNFLLTHTNNSIAVHDISCGKKIGAVSFPLNSLNRITTYCNTMDKIVVGSDQGLFVWDFRGTTDKRKLMELLSREENSALKKVRL